MPNPNCPKCKGKGEFKVTLFTSVVMEKCNCKPPEIPTPKPFSNEKCDSILEYYKDIKIEAKLKGSKKYAFYSAEAAELFGTVFWTTPDGHKVETTGVMDTPTGEGYMWKDKRFVAEVVDFAHKGQYGIHDTWYRCCSGN